MKIIQISTARTGTNEDQIIRNLFSVLQRTLPVQLLKTEIRLSRIKQTLASIARQVGGAASADAIIIHSPLVFSLPASFTARLFRNQIVAVLWDCYPPMINGRRYDTRLIRRIADFGERLALKLATSKVIPTSDFQSYSTLADAEVIPFWCGCAPAGHPRRKVRELNSVITIVFAGQVNETRGVREALVHLDRILCAPAEVHFFSRDPDLELGQAKLEKVAVQHHGFLAKEDLQKRLGDFDFGLVTLHPHLDVPGFPSKTLDYMSASLPTLYFGRDLPAFVGMLEATNTGVSISGLSELDLEEKLTRFNDITAGRQEFEDAIGAKSGAFDCLFEDHTQ